jgi:hypothetical protein
MNKKSNKINYNIMKKYLVHGVWLVVAILAFVGGMYYGKMGAGSQFAGRTGNFASSTRGGFAARGGSGGGFVTGQIVSKDAQSLTIQLPNGNSEIVFYSSSTAVIKPTAASVNDLTTGTNVMIGGTQNSDGSLTAQSIQVRNGNAPGARN